MSKTLMIGILTSALCGMTWFGCDESTSEADLTADILQGDPDQTDDAQINPEDLTEQNDLLPTDLDDQEVVGPVESVLAAPEGVVVAGGKVFVTNVNGAWNDELGSMVYGAGYVTVLDPQTMERVGHVELGCTNPQYVVAKGTESVLAVCSGKVAMDENWVMTPTEAGKLVQIDVASLKVQKTLELPMGNPSAMVGFPGSLCLDQESGRIFVGSATGPFVYVVEEEMTQAPQVVELYAMGAGNDSITVECGQGKVWAVSFNTGDLYTISAESLNVEGAVKVTETDQLEGPTDLLLLGQKLFVLNTISSKIAVVDLADDSVDFPAVTGATPNRLAAMDQVIFVVNSTDNNLTRYDTVSGDVITPFGAMETGMNPWEMATDGQFGFVTGYMSNTVVKVDLTSGNVVETAGN